MDGRKSISTEFPESGGHKAICSMCVASPKLQNAPGRGTLLPFTQQMRKPELREEVAYLGLHDQEVAELVLKHQEALLFLRKPEKGTVGNTVNRFDLQEA